MVVDQVQIEGVPVLETEDEAPVAADGQAPEILELTFQLMQPVAWKSTQVPDRVGCVDLMQEAPQPLDKAGPNASGVIVLE